jgi:hypothetical protein
LDAEQMIVKIFRAYRRIPGALQTPDGPTW